MVLYLAKFKEFIKLKGLEPLAYVRLDFVVDKND